MDLAQFWFQAAGGGGYEIANSLRFRKGQNLSRNHTISGSTQTVSFWIKKTQFDTAAGYQNIFYFEAGGKSQEATWWAGAANVDEIYWRKNSIASYSDGKFRDPGAWYHLVFKYEANLGSLYVNGQLRGTNSTAGNVTGTANYYIGAASPGTFQPMDGYITEYHFVDGQALDPTSFGEFNADGVWVPKEVTGLTYGTNGFYLDFSDPNNIGADRSGNGNNFTATGFDLTTITSANYDWMADSPTINTATANPLIAGLATNYFDANLRVQGVGLPAGSYPTIQIPNDANTPYYLEIELTSVGSGGNQAHIAVGDIYFAKDLSSGSFVYYRDDGVINGTGGYAPFANGDIIGIVVQPSANTVAFYHNGSNQLDITGVNFSTNWVIYGFQPQAGNPVWYWNLGQQPWRASFVPPGVQSISTAQLPDVAITNPSDHFSTILDTGANILTAAQAKFSNGLWWIKDRVNSNQHQLVDSVRGGNLATLLPSINPEQAYSAPAGNSVAWCWAVDGAAAPNSNGDIPSNVATNQAAGFSIGTFQSKAYTGTAADVGTVGHGLNQAPEFIMVSIRSGAAADQILVYHKDEGADKYCVMNGGSSGADAFITSTTIWENTAPTNQVFTMGSQWPAALADNKPMAFYAWHSVPGYSSIGTYVGNNSTDGPFVYTGFRPAFVMIKCSSTGSTDWLIFDSARETYNPNLTVMTPNKTLGEYQSTGLYNDFLSNGFKIRATNTEINGSGQTLVYIAFAEHCFGGSNVSPSPAR